MKANCLDACNYVVVFGSIESGKTVRYNDNNTVQVVSVVSVLEPMLFTEKGANHIIDIYNSMRCTCVTKMKFVEWQKANNK